MKSRQPIGWCPSVYRPMETGDGLLVRLRPHLGRLTLDQLTSLCEMASRYGNGMMTFTCRSNIQIRGLSEHTHTELVNQMNTLGLLDRDQETERRRNIIVSPFWLKGDETVQLANSLVRRLHELPTLPDKFGFTIDAGEQPCLSTASGDIRIERSKDGLIVRADRSHKGRLVTPDTALDGLMEMAEWFSRHRMSDQTRMAEIIAEHTLPSEWTTTQPLPTCAEITTRPTPFGDMTSIPFGQINAPQLNRIIASGNTKEIRLTPWYRILVRRHKDVTTTDPTHNSSTENNPIAVRRIETHPTSCQDTDHNPYRACLQRTHKGNHNRQLSLQRGKATAIR